MRRSPGPLVGRDAELRRLVEAVAAAAAGTSTTTLLGGDAGVGKTRLLHELALRAAADGAVVLLGACVEVGDYGLPYVPVIDALRGVEAVAGGLELLEAEAAARPALARLLPHLASVADRERLAGTPMLGEGMAQVQLFDAVRGVLGRVAATAPVLLVLEDLHWADRSTRDLVAFAVRTLRDTRVALVLSYRSDDLHRRHPLRPLLAELTRRSDVDRVLLEPLPAGPLARLMEARAGRALAPAVLAELQRRSEGNPFFAEELIDAEGEDDGAGLPVGLADVLLARVETLPAQAREVLRAASVGGRRVDVRLLAAVLGIAEETTEAALGEAVAAGLLLVDRSGYEFRHALVREAVHGDLLPGERVRLHGAYARELAPGEGGELAGQLAGSVAAHRLAAHDLPGALAALIRAAAHAESIAAPAEALQHLENALSLLEPLGRGEERLALLRRAAEAADTAGEPERAAAFGRDAVREADAGGDPIERAMTRERLARLVFEVDAEDPKPLAVQAEALLPPGPPSRARARVLATRLRMWDTEPPEEVGARLAAGEAEARAADAVDLAADVLLTRARVERLRMLPPVGDDPFALALALIPGNAAPVVRLRALRLLATELFEDGYAGRALTIAREGVALASAEGLAWSGYGLDLRLIEGWLLAAAGEWDAVLALARSAAVPPGGLGQVVATLELRVLVQRGDAGAEGLLARLRAGLSDLYAQVQLDLAETELALLAGDTERAARAAGQRFARLLPLGGSEPLLLAAGLASAAADDAVAARTAGDDVAAARQAARAAAAQQQLQRHAAAGPTYQQAPTRLLWQHQLAAEVLRASGSHAAEADCWRSALVAADAVARSYDGAVSAWRLAAALLELGSRGLETVAALRRAHDVAARVGAEPLRTRVEDLARRARLTEELGLTAAPAGVELTPREAEVLALVAAGMSNRAVGAALFISEKTASVHVSNILAKTGAASRTEAVAVARRRGLLP